MWLWVLNISFNGTLLNKTAKCSEFKSGWRCEPPEQLITYQQSVDAESISSFLHMSYPVKYKGPKVVGMEAWENQVSYPDYV